MQDWSSLSCQDIEQKGGRGGSAGCEGCFRGCAAAAAASAATPASLALWTWTSCCCHTVQRKGWSSGNLKYPLKQPRASLAGINLNYPTRNLEPKCEGEGGKRHILEVGLAGGEDREIHRRLLLLFFCKPLDYMFRVSSHSDELCNFPILPPLQKSLIMMMIEIAFINTRVWREHNIFSLLRKTIQITDL